MTDPYLARRLYQRRHARRRQRITAILWAGFIAAEVAIGGASGILIGALILDWIRPGHPVYLAIHDFIHSIF